MNDNLHSTRTDCKRKLSTTAESLDAVAQKAIQSGQSDETSDLTQAERVLSRVCAGRGKQLPIYEVQHAPYPSRSFISEVGRRKTTLNKEFGFDIRQAWVDGESVWWIVLGSDGYPVINWDAPMRRGMSSSRPIGQNESTLRQSPLAPKGQNERKPQAKKQWTDDRGIFGFSDLPKFDTPKPSPAEQRQMFESQFLSFETGRAR